MDRSWSSFHWRARTELCYLQNFPLSKAIVGCHTQQTLFVKLEQMGWSCSWWFRSCGLLHRGSFQQLELAWWCQIQMELVAWCWGQLDLLCWCVLFHHHRADRRSSLKFISCHQSQLCGCSISPKSTHSSQHTSGCAGHSLPMSHLPRWSWTSSFHSCLSLHSSALSAIIHL